MKYITLTQNEKDDVIVSFMHQQEMDHLCHSINKERYENILNDKDVNEEFKKKIQSLKNEVDIRLHEVEKIIEHSKHQLPSQERIDKAIERLLKDNIDK